MNFPRTAKTEHAIVRQVADWLIAIAMGVSVVVTAQAAKVDWNIPADPAAQRWLCADYPPEPSAGDISDFWDSPARRRIVACETLMERENPDPDLYYYAGRPWRSSTLRRGNGMDAGGPVAGFARGAGYQGPAGSTPATAGGRQVRPGAFTLSPGEARRPATRAVRPPGAVP